MCRKLLKLRHQAAEFIKMEIHNSKTVFFGSDYWSSLDHLIDVACDLGTRQLDIDKYATVSEAVTDNSWRFHRCHSRYMQQIITVIHLNWILKAESN